jgi:hypothetical protein
MAVDTTGSVSYYLSLGAEHAAYLSSIRHWENLKIAFEESVVWVKDLSPVQVDSLEVKSIPYKELYYAQDGKLFRKGSLLPTRNLPSLLWTPIGRGLPVRLPAYNHNYFGLASNAGIRLIPSEKETESLALRVDINVLLNYILTASAIRLERLQWVILGTAEALLLGTPLLPLQGLAFWQRGDFLLPAGFDLELYALSNDLNLLLNPEGDSWILWQEDGRYSKLNKQAFTPLSISSFRLTMERRTV